MVSLAGWIIEKGIDNINVNMLDASSKKLVLVEAGQHLIRTGNVKDGAKAIALSGDHNIMLTTGMVLIRNNDLANACTVLEPTKNRQMLDELGIQCVRAGMFETALKAYKASENYAMTKFIEMNIKK